MQFRLPSDRPALMGILNVTPDSFSDGGAYANAYAAVEAGLRMVDEGADLIDVGGESTRPGAEPVGADEEIHRTRPVVEALASRGIVVSIDTSKAIVAKEALEHGAQIVNDVTAFSDPAMAPLCAGCGCYTCLMHMQGNPRTMQAAPHYEDVVREVRSFLIRRATELEVLGVKRERIWIDPGIGFGKTSKHNLSLVRELHKLVATGYPVLIGVSRKSFIGKILGAEGDPLPPESRLEGTLAAQAYAQLQGAAIVRAHDVSAASRVIRMLQAIQGG